MPKPPLDPDELEARNAALDARVEALRHTHSIVGDSTFSALVNRLASEFGLPRPVAEELVDWLRDEGWLGGGRSFRLPSGPVWVGKFIKILKYIKEHPNSTSIYAVLAIWDDPALDDLNRHQNQAEFAASLGLNKAAVNNAVMDCAKHFGTPPRKDQRQAEACRTMSAVRIRRLEADSKKLKVTKP